MLIHNKDDIEFVIEFPCFLGHPVVIFINLKVFNDQDIITKEDKFSSQ